MQCAILQAFLQTVGALNETQREARDYGTGHLLYPAEIRFLEAVRQQPLFKAGQLSRTLGVTQGAVTQIADRLQEKGLLEKYTQPTNRKEKLYRLTPAGVDAWQGHQLYHESSNKRICAHLRSLNNEEIQTILAFLQALKDAMPVCAFPCDCSQTLHDCDPQAGSTAIKETEGGLPCWN